MSALVCHIYRMKVSFILEAKFLTQRFLLSPHWDWSKYCFPCLSPFQDNDDHRRKINICDLSSTVNTQYYIGDGGFGQQVTQTLLTTHLANIMIGNNRIQKKGIQSVCRDCIVVTTLTLHTVIVKNSSHRPTVANCWPTVGQQITDRLPTDYRQVTNRLVTVGNLKTKLKREHSHNWKSKYILILQQSYTYVHNQA